MEITESRRKEKSKEDDKSLFFEAEIIPTLMTFGKR